MLYREAEIQANYCQMFSNTFRVMILWSLAGKELSVGDLAEEIQTTYQNTSQHLRLMKGRGFVKSRREGSMVLYSLTSKALSDDYGLLSKKSPEK